MNCFFSKIAFFAICVTFFSSGCHPRHQDGSGFTERTADLDILSKVELLQVRLTGYDSLILDVENGLAIIPENENDQDHRYNFRLHPDSDYPATLLRALLTDAEKIDSPEGGGGYIYILVDNDEGSSDVEYYSLGDSMRIDFVKTLILSIKHTAERNTDQQQLAPFD